MRYYRNRTDAELETMFTEHMAKMQKLETALSNARETRHSLRHAIKRRAFNALSPQEREATYMAQVAHIAMAERPADAILQ